MTDRTDLIVVGASFAGLVAAKRAAERGLSVTVLERKVEPGAHVHTTGILVKEAWDALSKHYDVPGSVVRPVPGVRLYAPNLKHIDLASEGYAFYATATPDFLRWLAGEATAAGVDLRCDTRFEAAERTSDGFRLPDLGLEGRYILGADGAKSRVAEAFGLGVNRRFLVGLEVEYRGVEGLDDRFLHTFLDSKIAPGYIGWVVPGAGVTQVGLACKRADKPNLARFEARVRDLFDFSKAEVVERRSGVIPCGGVIRPASAPGVLLVGDSAGMVSPMTAGGIFTAFDYGRRAADAIANHLEAGAPDPAATLPRTYPKFRIKKLLRRTLDLGPPNWFLNAAVGTRPMQALARLVYFHTKGLSSKKAWQEMARGADLPDRANGPH